MADDASVWFIAGCESRIARALAEELLDGGGRVVVTARALEEVADLELRAPERALALGLDVGAPGAVEAAARRVEKFGRVDLLVNAAARALCGAVEEASDDEARRLFDTNVFGALSLVRAVLPHFRARGSGRVIQFTSLGGIVGRPGLGLFNASRFAVEGFCEALAQEVKPLGIEVILVEPGTFRSEWRGRRARTERSIEAYAATSGRMVDHLDATCGREPGCPRRAARAILRVARDPFPPLRLVLGGDAVDWIRGKLDAVNEELSGWERTSRDTLLDEEVG